MSRSELAIGSIYSHVDELFGNLKASICNLGGEAVIIQ